MSNKVPPNNENDDLNVDIVPPNFNETTENSIESLLTFESSDKLIVPSQLKEYDKLYNGFAKKELDNHILNAQHQRDIELQEIDIYKRDQSIENRKLDLMEKIYDKNLIRSYFGSSLGTVIAAFGLLATYNLALQGHDNVAIAIVTSIGAIVSIIIGANAFSKKKSLDTSDKPKKDED